MAAVKPKHACVSIHDRVVEHTILAAGLFVGALVMGVAQSSTVIHWIAWISLLPLFMTARRLSGLHAALCGALWGTTSYIAAVVVAAPPATISWSSCLLHCSLPALYLYAISWFTHRFGYSPLAMALGWVLVEGCFRWTGISVGCTISGLSFGSFSAIIANFLGCGFIAFFVAYTNAVLISIVDELRLTFVACDVRNIFVKSIDSNLLYIICPHLTLCYRATRSRSPPMINLLG